MNMKLQISSVVLLSWLVFLPLFVVGECTCDAQEQEKGTDVKQALKLKIGAIASILVASAIGVCLPILCKKNSFLAPESDFFFLVKAFAAGIILGTTFIHILPDAFENLTSPCLNASPWRDFPFTGFIAMVTATLTLMVDTIATAYYKRRSQVTSALPINNIPDDEQPSDSGGHIHMHGHGHSHTLILEEDSAGTLDRHRVISMVLEAGIAVHSVIIGITVGVSQSPSTVTTLMVALIVHQLFEGMGLGGCLVQLAGVHWCYQSTSHAAELTTGFYNPANRDGYTDIIAMLKKHDVALNFTCVELQTVDQPPDVMADPERLPWQVLNVGWDHGLKVAAENALPCYTREGYEKILVIARPYDSSDGRHLCAFTYLRLSSVLLEDHHFKEFKVFVTKLHVK